MNGPKRMEEGKTVGAGNRRLIMVMIAGWGDQFFLRGMQVVGKLSFRPFTKILDRPSWDVRTPIRKRFLALQDSDPPLVLATKQATAKTLF